MTFFNIFSKKPVKIGKDLEITIDHREKNSLVPSYLKELGFQINYKQLPVADYIINNIAIERKTISDLKSSIINKRIFQQLIELKQYPKHFLILEGFQHSGTNNEILHENAFRGFLLSVALDYQTPIIFTQDEKDTAKYLKVLAKKPAKQEEAIRASKTLMSEREQAQFILEGFPNIGPKAATKLLDNFKSLKEIFNTSQKELEAIIGRAKAKGFFDLLTNQNLND